MLPPGRRIAAAAAASLVIAPLGVLQPTTAGASGSADRVETAGANGVTIQTPRRGIVLRSGCRASAERITVIFPVETGDDVYVNVAGVDGDGGSVNGTSSPFEGTAPQSGTASVTDRFHLCGELHSAGRGKVRAVLLVGDDDLTATKPISFRYDSAVTPAKPPAKVARGARVTLKGVWSRGRGFSSAVGYLNRQQQRIVLQRRVVGKKAWKQAATVRIDDRGRWSTRVRVTASTTWRAVVRADHRNLGTASQVRRITVRR